MFDLLKQFPLHEQARCMQALQKIMELDDAKIQVTAFLDHHGGDTRMVARAARLMALDAYLNLLKATYVEASEVLGFSTESVADWPTGTWLKVPDTEELVELLADFVAGKRDAVESMPISQLLDELQASPQFH